MHAGGGTNDRGEKRNVLIVVVLLLIGSNLTLHSNTQRRIQILRVRQAPVLLHVAGRPKPVMGDAEVQEQSNIQRSDKINEFHKFNYFNFCITV